MLDDAELTRKIYEKQHFRRTRDEEAFSRIERQYAGSSFGIPEEFFVVLVGSMLDVTMLEY